MSTDSGINVNMVDTSTLYNVHCDSIFDYITYDVIPGYLQEDNCHLNYWGYEAVIKDLVTPIMAHVGNMHKFV